MFAIICTCYLSYSMVDYCFSYHHYYHMFCTCNPLISNNNRIYLYYLIYLYFLQVLSFNLLYLCCPIQIYFHVCCINMFTLFRMCVGFCYFSIFYFNNFCPSCQMFCYICSINMLIIISIHVHCCYSPKNHHLYYCCPYKIHFLY